MLIFSDLPPFASLSGPVCKWNPAAYEILLGNAFLKGFSNEGAPVANVSLWGVLFTAGGCALILDEPTSAIDPWAEADWLDRFRAVAAGCTSLLITHRLTTAMRADLVCVIVNGEIAESGSHGDLIERRGLYAQSWERQTKSNRLVRT